MTKRLFVALVVFAALALVTIQAQGPVLAWDHPGADEFRVSFNGLPAMPIQPVSKDGHHEWTLPDVPYVYTLILEACNAVKACTPSAPILINLPPPPMNLRQTATGRLGTGIPSGDAFSSAPENPATAPTTPENPSPAHGATGVSITPTLSYDSTDVTVYKFLLGTTDPPTNVIGSGPSTALVISAPLAYNTTYYWRGEPCNAAGCNTSGPVWSFTTITEPISVPENLTLTAPADGATGVSRNPSLTCTADGATSYSIKFGTDTPPSNIANGVSLGSACLYQPATLTYGQTYYWRITATNSAGSAPESAIRSFTVVADPGASSFCVRPCQRLLSAAQKTELQGWRTANTAEWAAMKAWVDNGIVAGQDFANARSQTTTITSALGTGGAGTTISLADGSWLPTTEHTVRIDFEVIRVTRSGNTLTVVRRGEPFFSTTVNAPHAAGASVWYHDPTGASGGMAVSTALLVQAGETSYNVAARHMLNELIAYFGYQLPWGNDIGSARRYGYEIALAYDYIHHLLTANEKSVYAELMRSRGQGYLDNPKEGNPPQAQTQAALESVASNNVMNGTVRAGLAFAAATAGDQDSAEAHWDQNYAKVTNWIVPAMVSGAASNGMMAEGAHYSQSDWMIFEDLVSIVNAAIGTSIVSDTATFRSRMAKYMMYAIAPGTNLNSTSKTLCSFATASRTATCTVATGLAIGDRLTFTTDAVTTPSYVTLTVDNAINTDVSASGWTISANDVGARLIIFYNSSAAWTPGEYVVESVVNGKWRLDQSPAAAGSTNGFMRFVAYNTVITGISGTTLTLRDPAPIQATSRAVFRRQTWAMSFGDLDAYRNFDEEGITNGEPQIAAMLAQSRLRGVDDTLTQHIEYMLDNQMPTLPNYHYWRRFMTHDPSIVATNYTTTLPLNLVSADPDGFGYLFGKSAWTGSASYVAFVGGHMAIDHATSYYGSFRYLRSGVTLTGHLIGYGATNIKEPPPWFDEVVGSNPAESPYLGARYHNTVSMNGHGSVNPVSSNAPGDFPATMTRGETNANWVYGRNDASGAYQVYLGTGVHLSQKSWTQVGWPNNNAQTYVRDFFYLNPDLIVYHDRMGYASATVSPTRWHIVMSGDPSLASQRATMTYAGQKLVTDVVLPASATIAEVNHADEDQHLRGYRLEITSGQSASTEYGLTVMQGMDEASSPSAVTTLTTTNANVIEVAAGDRCASGCVVGFVKGASPTLNITYTYAAANPDHYLFGFAASTAYHVVESGGTVTISAATGTGDTTSSAAGALVF